MTLQFGHLILPHETFSVLENRVLTPGHEKSLLQQPPLPFQPIRAEPENPTLQSHMHETVVANFGGGGLALLVIVIAALTDFACMSL